MRKIAAFAGSVRNSFAFCQLPLRRGPADSGGDAGGGEALCALGVGGALRGPRHLWAGSPYPSQNPAALSPAPQSSGRKGCSLPAPPCSPGGQAPREELPARWGLVGDGETGRAPRLAHHSQALLRSGDKRPHTLAPQRAACVSPHTAGRPCHSPAGQTLWGSLTPGTPSPGSWTSPEVLPCALAGGRG